MATQRACASAEPRLSLRQRQRRRLLHHQPQLRGLEPLAAPAVAHAAEAASEALAAQPRRAPAPPAAPARRLLPRPRPRAPRRRCPAAVRRPPRALRPGASPARARAASPVQQRSCCPARRTRRREPGAATATHAPAAAAPRGRTARGRVSRVSRVMWVMARKAMRRGCGAARRGARLAAVRAGDDVRHGGVRGPEHEHTTFVCCACGNGDVELDHRRRRRRGGRRHGARSAATAARGVGRGGLWRVEPACFGATQCARQRAAAAARQRY